MLPDSFFATTALHERPVTLPDGSTHILWFRELPAVQWSRFSADAKSEDTERREQAIQRVIAESLCDPDGKPAMTLEKAMTLKVQPMMAIYNAILDVNAQGKKKPEEKAEEGNA